MSLVVVEGEPIRDGWMYVGVPSSGDDFLKDIEEKQNPNFVNSYGLSALCMAVKAFQSPSLVEKLLKMNADPNFESYIGKFLGTRKTEKPSGSPLHVAAWLRHSGITKVLLDGGADPNTVAFNSLTPLLLVLSNTRRMGQRNEPFIEQAALDVMKLLIDNGADVTAIDNTKTDGTSLLHMATQVGHVLIVNYLLSLRALDVNCRNIHEETPLMIALREDRQELLEDLLLHGVDPNSRDMAGCTALHIAVGRTCVKSVEILIQNSADVNIKDSSCRTALHVASRLNNSSSKSNVKVMKSLLSNNADVNVADNQGRPPLHLTVIDNKDTLDMTALECLLEHDADPSLTDAIERMPLSYYTAFHGDDIPKQIGLLSRGCSNLNNKDIIGRPPLLAIVWYFMERRNIMEEESDIVEFQKVIRELVEAGVDINCQDIEGSTCLHHTVGRKGRTSSHLKFSDFTRVLLDAGADRNARDVDGNTPAHIAAEGEDADQLRMLASETWQDSPNLNGETVKDILCRKVTLAKERQKIGVNFEFAAQTLESFRFEDQNEDEDEDEALGFRHKEIFKPFRLQLGRDNVVAINFVVPAKLKTKKFEDFLVSKTKCFVLVLVFLLVLESKALYYISLKI
ncbi:ankyrin-1-like [Acropora muricata]|uniref:ankyrin-1-like n=1 Tax=Acropora muricata TaxID=159855 RepID=UPI0034E3FCB5